MAVRPKKISEDKLSVYKLYEFDGKLTIRNTYQIDERAT